MKESIIEHLDAVAYAEADGEHRDCLHLAFLKVAITPENVEAVREMRRAHVDVKSITPARISAWISEEEGPYRKAIAHLATLDQDAVFGPSEEEYKSQDVV